MKPAVSIIVAMAENGCIGVDGDLPWHVPEDLKRFKALTLGKPVIMGRKTFESIVARLGKPLPGRDNIVISRAGFVHDGVIVCPDLDTALAKTRQIAATQNLDEIFIGGGAQIYELALPLTDRIYLTRVHTVVNGDAFFPPLDPKQWRETACIRNDGNPSFTFTTLVRVQSQP